MNAFRHNTVYISECDIGPQNLLETSYKIWASKVGNEQFEVLAKTRHLLDHEVLHTGVSDWGWKWD